MITLIVLVGMILFGGLHSLAAGKTVKNAVKSRVGERAYHGFYRLGYNIFAAGSLLPFGILLLFYPGMMIWQITGVPEIAFRGLQVAGTVGLTISLLQIDLGQFSGFSQVHAYFTGNPLPLPAETLQTGGVYRLFRHPLYVFSLLVIWFQPMMSEALFAFNLGATVYFLLGSRLEERRLIDSFGDQYRAYQTQVRWMLPRLRRKPEQRSNNLSIEQTSQLR